MVLDSVPMAHVQVQVPNRDAAAVTHCIAAQGLLHLVDIAHGHVALNHSGGDARQLLAAFRDVSSRILRIAERLGLAVNDLSGSVDTGAPADLAAERRLVEAAVRSVETEVNEVWSKVSAARDALKLVENTAAHAARLRQAGIALERLSGLRFLALRIGLTTPTSIAEIAALSSPAPVAVVPLATDADRVVVAVATASGSADRIEAALRLVPFEPIDVARCQARSAGEFAAMRAETAAQVTTFEGALHAIAGERAATIVELWHRAELAVVLLQAQLNFAVSGRFLVIAGWMPADRSDALAARVHEISQGRAVVTIERPEDLAVTAHALRIPILHHNPVLLRPFESLVQMYGTPTYREVQPTAFFAVSFLVMFGLMFGDVGHGTTLFAAGYCLYRWLPRFLDYGILLMEVGCASATFGFLYGSLFGIEGLLPVLWIEPVRELPRFMAVAIAIGVGLITCGFVLNVINSWRAGERRAALFGLHGLFGAFLYWCVLALAVRFIKPVEWTVPPAVVTLLLTAAVLLVVMKRPIIRWIDGVEVEARRPGSAAPLWLAALESSVEVVDALITFFANTVSFIRIAAFAAVHAGLFVAMFALADTLSAMRFGGVLSIAALVVGNIVIILLEGLTVSVQVLRLEYYEFFSKFFRGGGEPYRPLLLRTEGHS